MFPGRKLGQQKTQLENLFGIVFEKVKSHGG